MPPKEVTQRQGIYFIRCVRLSENPEQWYWHLYREEVRVNGGLNDSIEDAMWAGGISWRKDSGLYWSKPQERV